MQKQKTLEFEWATGRIIAKHDKENSSDFDKVVLGASKDSFFYVEIQKAGDNPITMDFPFDEIGYSDAMDKFLEINTELENANKPEEQESNKPTPIGFYFLYKSNINKLMLLDGRSAVEFEDFTLKAEKNEFIIKMDKEDVEQKGFLPDEEFFFNKDEGKKVDGGKSDEGKPTEGEGEQESDPSDKPSEPQKEQKENQVTDIKNIVAKYFGYDSVDSLLDYYGSNDEVLNEINALRDVEVQNIIDKNKLNLTVANLREQMLNAYKNK